MMSAAKGKLTIYSTDNKQNCLKKIGNHCDDILLKNIRKSIREIKKEMREYRDYLNTKRGYCDYQQLKSSNIALIGKPSSQPNFEKMIKLDLLDMKMLHYFYSKPIICDTITGISKRFNLKYHKTRRRLNKLTLLGLIEKMAESPAIYDKVKNKERLSLVSQFVGYFFKLFPMANLQEVQNNSS